MRKDVLALAVFLTLVVVGTASAADLPDLKIAKVEIVPYSEKDLKQDAFWQGRAMVEFVPAGENGAKPAKAKAGDERLQLPTYRSYRFIVTVRNVGKAGVPSSFLVRTECVRDGKRVTLGKARINLDRAAGYACYDVFPAEGGPGACLIRTVVDADKEIKQADERAAGKTFEFKASIPN
jgi:hypothetical protein